MRKFIELSCKINLYLVEPQLIKLLYNNSVTLENNTYNNQVTVATNSNEKGVAVALKKLSDNLLYQSIELNK